MPRPRPNRAFATILFLLAMALACHSERTPLWHPDELRPPPMDLEVEAADSMYYRKARAAYDHMRWVECLGWMAQITPADSQGSELSQYRAVCYLALDQPDKSIAFLQNENPRDRWLLALALLRKGDGESATPILQDLYQTDPIYREKSLLLLQRIQTAP